MRLSAASARLQNIWLELTCSEIEQVSQLSWRIADDSHHPCFDQMLCSLHVIHCPGTDLISSLECLPCLSLFRFEIGWSGNISSQPVLQHPRYRGIAAVN